MPTKTINRISREYWLTLDQVALRLAQELLRDDIPVSLSQIRSHNSRTWDDILSDFRKMISSEDVCIRHDTPRGFTKLALDQSNHELTVFDFETSTVCIAGIAEWTFEVHVNKNDLETFLRDVNSARSGYKNKKERESACWKWLEIELQRPEPAPRDELIGEAHVQFDVSKSFILKARERIIEDLGLIDLRKPGRRKKSL